MPVTRSNRTISVTSSVSSRRKSQQNYLNLVEERRICSNISLLKENQNLSAFANTISFKYKFFVLFIWSVCCLIYLCKMRPNNSRNYQSINSTNYQFNYLSYWNKDNFCFYNYEQLNFLFVLRIKYPDALLRSGSLKNMRFDSAKISPQPCRAVSRQFLLTDDEEKRSAVTWIAELPKTIREPHHSPSLGITGCIDVRKRDQEEPSDVCKSNGRCF